jgi:hypothetical protein
VFGYFCLYAAVKTLSYFIIAMLAVIICVIAKNSAFVYFTAGIVTVVQTLLYVLISPVSALSVFKYVNIIALTQPNEIFKNYLNINFFGEPLNVITVSAATAFVLITILTISAFALFKKCSAAHWNNNALSDFLSRFSSGRIHVNILRHETYKVYVYNRALLVIIALIIIQYFAASGTREYIDTDEMFFKNYVERAGGFVTEETRAFIETEQARFDEIQAALFLAGKKYADGEITATDYNIIQSNIQMMLTPKKAFDRFTERVDYIETSHPDGQVIYDKGWKEIFGVNDYGEDMRTVLMFLLFAIIIISPAYSAENENGMMNIIVAAPRKLTWAARYFTNFTAALIVVAAVSLPFMANTLSFHTAAGADAIIQSIPEFSKFPLSVSVRGYMALLLITRVFGAAVAVFILQTVSLYSAKKTTAILVSLSVLALPATIYFTGAEFFAGFGLNALIGGNVWLREFKAGNAVFVSAIIGVVGALVARKIARDKIETLFS